MKSYEYANRSGVRAISWEELAEMSHKLAEKLAEAGVDAIVGIARGGLFPATQVACYLRKELFPVRLTRRYNDEVNYSVPVWKTPVSPEVKGKVVVVIDEIADSGQTLAMVKEEVARQGASKVISACLVRHSWSAPGPDVAVLVSDEFIIFPWDRQVLIDGIWQEHPEIVAGLEAQGDDTKQTN